MKKNKNKNPYLSVILPSFNELDNIKKEVLQSVYKYLSEQSYDWELVLSDDGSSDGTLEELEKFAASHDRTIVVKNAHRGKAPTVQAGMFKAQGDLRLFADFDQATPIEEVEKLLPFVKRGYDVIIGSREIEGSKREQEPFHRHLMGKVFNIFVQLFAIQNIHDTQCGFKLFTEKAVKTLFPLLYIYGPNREVNKKAFTGAFDVELLYLARRKKLRIAEVPVFWKHVKTVRVNPIKDSFIMFFDLLRIRFADLTGKYSNQ